MDGEYQSGDYETPDGQAVHVFRSFGGWWACAVVQPGGKKVTAEELTPGFWRQLRRRSLRAERV